MCEWSNFQGMRPRLRPNGEPFTTSFWWLARVKLAWVLLQFQVLSRRLWAWNNSSRLHPSQSGYHVQNFHWNWPWIWISVWLHLLRGPIPRQPHSRGHTRPLHLRIQSGLSETENRYFLGDFLFKTWILFLKMFSGRRHLNLVDLTAIQGKRHSKVLHFHYLTFTT